MRSAESVEEMQERYAAFYRGEVSNRAEVHNFLNAVGAKKGKAGLAAGHYVAVISEDGESVGSESTC
jgi:hypothetical protein